MANASETVESNTGRVGVGDVIVVEGVGDDNRSGSFVARKEDAKVVKREEVRWEMRVWKSEKVVERVGVAHGRRGRRRQCRERG